MSPSSCLPPLARPRADHPASRPSAGGCLLALALTLFLSSCANPSQYASPSSTHSMDAVVAKARTRGLIPVKEAVPDIVIEIPYATTNNFSGRAVYPNPMPVLLRRETAYRLAHAQQTVKRLGYGLKLYDAWRPPGSHLALWRAFPDSRFLADPSEGVSTHAYGIAVDVSLVDAQGKEVPMPSAFDEFNESARSFYTGNDPEVRRNLAALQHAMRVAGFQRIQDEWWHFDDFGVPDADVVFAKEIGLELPVPYAVRARR